MTLGAPLAYLSPDRGVYTLDLQGRHRAQTGADVPALLMGSWKTSAGGDSGLHSWPTWSPDGRSIACFRLPDDEEPASRVVVVEVDGVASAEVANLSDRLPIYLFWSPNGRHLAVLSQRGEQLRLSLARPDGDEGELPLVEGSPLFFTWAGGDRVAAFIGGSGRKPSRLALIDPRASSQHLLPGLPGGFCAPLWWKNQAIYVTATGDDGHAIVRASAEDAAYHTLERINGLVAMATSPDGAWIARATALGGDGTPYRDLAILSPETGEVRRLNAGSCLAFVWIPDASGLVVARVDTERNLLSFDRVDLHGHRWPLGELHPTRDFGFYLRFFEQYGQSHPIVSPDGRWLVLAGALVGRAGPEDPPRLWAIPLSGGAAVDLGPGVFAVFGPSPGT